MELDRLRSERNAVEYAQHREIEWTENNHKELEKLKMQL